MASSRVAAVRFVTPVIARRACSLYEPAVLSIFPGFVPPCLPTKAKEPPTGGLWLHEIKHDGFRIIAITYGFSPAMVATSRIVSA
jgi:ATP-dependent DNA ligase